MAGGKGSASSSTASARRRFKFHKRSQLFIRMHNKTVSVAAMRVSNADCSPARIEWRARSPTPTGFPELFAIIPHRSCAAPAHTHGIAIDSTGAHGDAYSISNHLRNSRVTCGRLRNACIRARSGPSIDASSRTDRDRRFRETRPSLPASRLS
jgi:hypothetical protein